MSQSERLVLATRYRLIAELGQGANGKVWRAHDELLDRAVAVKELRLPEDLSEAERIVFYRRTLREARAPAQLRTPSIVEVYDVVIEQGRPWIVMELIEAFNLEQLIAKEGPLAPERVAHIGKQLLDALGTAHNAGILHRDIKPSNVLLDEGDRVVLTDFGLAVSSGSASITKSGQFMGSPAYVAPEVAAGEKATPKSDLWSLGATLYAAVEGNPPFERGNVMATLSALANEDPPPMQKAGPLESVISGLLEKSPTRRLGHDRAVDRLERALTGPRSSRGTRGTRGTRGAVSTRTTVSPRSTASTRGTGPVRTLPDLGLSKLGDRQRRVLTLSVVGAIVAAAVIGGGVLVVGMLRDEPPDSASASEQTTAAVQPPPEGVLTKALVVRATGDKCRLFVAYPGTSTVIFDGPLHKGEVGQYDAPRLEAVVSDAADCAVWINGVEKPAGRPGERITHRVVKTSPPR